MTTDLKYNYERIRRAIAYIHEHYDQQPDLDAVAAQIHLSPFHFQRVFTEWAGVSPKKFLQFTTLQYAKRMLADEQRNLNDVAWSNGLSGSGRLHDLFVQIEGMTPGEYKSGGEGLLIRYSMEDTLFGKIGIAATDKGICQLQFIDDDSEWNSILEKEFPHAILLNQSDDLQQRAINFLNLQDTGLQKIRLHLKASPFQLKIWEALLRIPPGRLVSYSQLAAKADQPSAVRAAGTAIGDNPVAFLIPCHRVIKSSGLIGQYHWGSDRKLAMIALEAARFST